jgi:choline dehydrogenase-like flavoprotein
MKTSPLDADVIVVGSGPAGVSAAFPLVAAGVRVLMLDGARAETVSKAVASWKKVLGPDLEALRPEDGLSPKLRTPISRQIVGAFHEQSGIRGDGFVAVGAHARGGLSRVWGGFVCEFGPDDLQGWPVTADDLRSSYKTVIERVGVSGSVTDDMAEFYGRSGDLLAPLPLGPTAAHLLARYAKFRCDPEFALGVARNAILTADRDERKACDLGGDCLWGCERGAIYDAKFDLEALRRHAQFSLVDQALVRGLARSGNAWEVSVWDGRTFRGSRVILAAGALSTAAIARPLLPDLLPGLRLLSNPVLAMPLLVLARLGRRAPSKGYSLAQLGYRLQYGAAASDYVCGAVYELAGLPTSSFVSRLPLGRRAGGEFFSALAPALLVATAYFPGACSANKLTWEWRDGRCSVVVRGGFDIDLADKAKHVIRRLAKTWRRLGAWMLPGTSLAPPGADVHFAGPFGMGADRPHGTNSYGELHAAPGVSIVDGAAFPTLPAKYPTLTIMANADRIGRHMASRRPT